MAKSRDKFLYRPYITLRDGRRIYASQYGKKVFRIPINDDDDPRQPTLPGL